MLQEEEWKQIEQNVRDYQNYISKLVGRSPILSTGYHDPGGPKQIHNDIVSQFEWFVNQTGKFQMTLFLLTDNGSPNRQFLSRTSEAWLKFCDWHRLAEQEISHNESFHTRSDARRLLDRQLDESLDKLCNLWAHPIIKLARPTRHSICISMII